MNDVLRLLEQHDQARQQLLDGESEEGLEEHVAQCPVCGPLAARLAEVEQAIREIPEAPADLLGKILRRSSRPRSAAMAYVSPEGGGVAAPKAHASRLEMLWPAEAGPEASAQADSITPLVLAVEADRHPSDAPHARPLERFIIVGRYPILIGRGPDMDVPVWDRSVSRRHAEIDYRDEVWTIRDLESTNGTRVNGTALGPSDVRELAAGDQVDLGFYARVTVRSLLQILHPNGAAREIHRLLALVPRADPASR